MNISGKHIVAFLLGVAAGLTAAKYASMTSEEKEKLMKSVKDKTNTLKNQVERVWAKAKNSFQKWFFKRAENAKTYMAEFEKTMSDLFNKNTA